MRKRSVKIAIMIVLCIAMTFSSAGNYVVEAAPGSGGVIGQICLMAFDYAPPGWVKCDGRPLSINENQELFSLIGTKFGGDGSTTFNVPNMQSPIQGAVYCIATEGSFPSGTIMENDALLGQIELFPFELDVYGWVKCNGQMLLILQNQKLFDILGTAFGGDGEHTMCLPNLQGAAPEGMNYYICVEGEIPNDGNYSSNNSLLGSINLYRKSPNLAGIGECDGGQLSRVYNSVLYSIIGTRYGGNGSTTFAKPDLRGFTPDPELAFYLQTQGIYPLED